MPANILAQRLGVFVRLSEALEGNLGRTSLMKLCYFLQNVRNVPLGYHFSLYSYGPFDSDVLSDLQTAENLNILQADVVTYSGGYGYRITPNAEGEKTKELAREFLTKYKKDIDWVTASFGDCTAGDLELLSTIFFVYQEGGVHDRNKLVERVSSIKPHFSEDQIRQRSEWLARNRLLG